MLWLVNQLLSATFLFLIMWLLNPVKSFAFRSNTAGTCRTMSCASIHVMINFLIALQKRFHKRSYILVVNFLKYDKKRFMLTGGIVQTDSFVAVLWKYTLPLSATYSFHGHSDRSLSAADFKASGFSQELCRVALL